MYIDEQIPQYYFLSKKNKNQTENMQIEKQILLLSLEKELKYHKNLSQKGITNTKIHFTYCEKVKKSQYFNLH